MIQCKSSETEAPLTSAIEVSRLSRPSNVTPILRFLVVFLTLGVSAADGQVFQVGGGTSSLYQASGGSVEMRGEHYDGWVGAGVMDGFRLGAFLRTQALGSTFSFGDDTIPFRLPTDVFDSSHYFLARGVGITHAGERVRVYGFAGASSLGLGTPFFLAAQAQKAMALLFLDSALTPKLHAFSRTVLSNRQTTIEGLDWQPWTDIHAAVSGGVGANHGYFASSLTAEKEWISVKAAYILAGDQFRRISVLSPLTSEVDHENIYVTLRPRKFLALSAGRQNFLQPVGQGQTSILGTVNEFSASMAGAGFTMGAALFDSHSQHIGNTGTSFSVGRDIEGRVKLNGDYLRSRATNGKAYSTVLGTIREIISPRLSLLQLVNQSDGHSSVSFGGDLLTNRVVLGVEYQTTYVPFRAGNQFKQALVLNIHLQPFGNISANLATFVAPDGSVKYTASAGTFLYRGAFMQGIAAGTTAVTLLRYIARGRVVDVDGKPVRGAALSVGKELAFTDSDGEFFVRMKRAGAYRLEVLPDQFLVSGHFEVISAPAAVQAAPEETAPEITIVVRRKPALLH